MCRSGLSVKSFRVWRHCKKYICLHQNEDCKSNEQLWGSRSSVLTNRGVCQGLCHLWCSVVGAEEELSASMLSSSAGPRLRKGRVHALWRNDQSLEVAEALHSPTCTSWGLFASARTTACISSTKFDLPSLFSKFDDTDSESSDLLVLVLHGRAFLSPSWIGRRLCSERLLRSSPCLNGMTGVLRSRALRNRS